MPHLPSEPRRPSGLTPDPLDYSFSWHLLCVLGAIGALPPAAAGLPPAAAARMSFVAQLEAVGGLAHWAVYAALHIPDAAERCKVGTLQRGQSPAPLAAHSGCCFGGSRLTPALLARCCCLTLQPP